MLNQSLKYLLVTLLCLSLSIHTTQHATQNKDIHLVVFSYNRPMQLYALLESVEEFVTGLTRIGVIYRTDSSKYDKGYALVQERFPRVAFHKQSLDPRADFKPLTMREIRMDRSHYILFAVDDIIVTDHIDLSRCVKSLEKNNAYGFYLRLGHNITECYSEHTHSGTPKLTEVDKDIYSWRFNTGAGDWRYPNSVDMVLVRKADILEEFATLPFISPNTLEALWNSKFRNLNDLGLCFKHSKIINIPLNLVQHDYQNNRHMTQFSTEKLLETFLAGMKINRLPLFKIENKAPHMEHVPQFMQRTEV